jgi:hypothetical protein
MNLIAGTSVQRQVNRCIASKGEPHETHLRWDDHGTQHVFTHRPAGANPCPKQAKKGEKGIHHAQ